MSNRFASKRRALGVCDRCGFTYKLKQLQKEAQKGRPVDLMVCYECWDPDHPQLRIGEVRVDDPQAIQDPRPDNAELASVRSLTVPVSAASARGAVGSVSTTTI